MAGYRVIRYTAIPDDQQLRHDLLIEVVEDVPKMLSTFEKYKESNLSPEKIRAVS